jgi:hypothetical protein
MTILPSTIDKHTLALISVIGSSLDVLGAMYLAYDLLGGEHGPLRTLTRAVTYGALFAAGYGLALGPVFGLANGVAHGVTLAWEFSRASRHQPKPGFWMDVATSAIRGAGYAVGALYSFGAVFSFTFGILSTIGQVIAYQFGVRPTVDYKPATRPRITRLQLLAALNRTAGYAATGYLSSLAAGHRERALATGLKFGVAVGVVTAVAMACTPFIEWTADHMAERRMGVVGVGLIFIGFALQSVQYWLVLLDINVR